VPDHAAFFHGAELPRSVAGMRCKHVYASVLTAPTRHYHKAIARMRDKTISVRFRPRFQPVDATPHSLEAGV